MKNIFFALVCFTLASCKFRQKIDLIVYNASIYTVDDKFRVVEAMAIKDGKIVETGSNALILRKYEAKEAINAMASPVFPGFIDAHCHFTGYATDRWKCDLTGTRSFNEVIEKVVDYSKTAPAEWIYGRGWDQNDWEIKEYPDKNILDSLFPDRPVLLKRVDGHAVLVNQVALNRAGITVASVVKGGRIETKDGKLTGILIDNAMDLVDRIVPEIADSLAQKYFLELQHECFSVGLTGVHDCGVSEKTIRLIKEEQDAGRLYMKVYALLADSSQYYDRWIKSGPMKTGLLHVGGFKIYADGALGSRGACLLEDYADKAGWKGFLLTDISAMKQTAGKLVNSSLQLCTHAIGDSANRAVLTIYGEVLKGKNDRRWRIEHTQVVDRNDLKLFSLFSIIPSVQPTHATSDMYWAGDRLGQRLKNAYAYRDLLKTNGWLPLGTDFPVESISPFKTFYAAVFRKDANQYPAGGFQIENSLSRQDAIRGMTIWAAKAAFEEHEKGSLEKGKAADFIIVDKDIIRCAESEVLKAKVLSTYINGLKVFEKRSN